jgi:tRNA 2-thiouridine synthesizing protein A
MSILQLDLTGLKCPLPALKTRKALQKLQAGEEIYVLTTDPMAVIDIPSLLQDLGDTLIMQTSHAQEGYENGHKFHIRRHKN